MTRHAALPSLALALSACGATTGLREGDAGPDVLAVVDRPGLSFQLCLPIGAAR